MWCYSRKNTAKIRGLGGKITKCPSAENTVRMVTKYVVLARLKFFCFDQLDRKVIPEIFPHSQSSYEVRSPPSVVWGTSIDEISPAQIQNGDGIVWGEKQAENNQGPNQRSEKERIIVKCNCCGFQSAMKRDAKRGKLYKRHFFCETRAFRNSRYL